MKTAMILAAGRGERLRPLTDSIPKALCTVKNKPLIEHHVARLAAAGFERIVVNHAYLGGQIRHYLGTGEQWNVDICYSPEPPGGLETCGGIVNALPLLGSEPFLVVNGDIYTDFDFATLELNDVPYMHFVLVPKDPALNHHGDFGLINQNQPTNENREYTYPGIACYNPQIFQQCHYGRYSLTPLIRHYVDEQKATACLHEGIWCDIGSMARLETANRV